VEPGVPPTLVFVEVRSRSSHRFGAPEETIDSAKVARTYRAAFTLLRARRLPDGRALPPLRWRVDLVAVDRRPLRPEDVEGLALRHVRGIARDCGLLLDLVPARRPGPIACCTSMTETLSPESDRSHRSLDRVGASYPYDRRPD
jgi:Holliday junction resolvase-like predicted endonuclease